MEHKGHFQIQLVHILDMKINVLRNQAIGLVKVQCTNYDPEGPMWEHKEVVKEEYPHVFTNFEEK
jgi:hypothetical protein